MALSMIHPDQRYIEALLNNDYAVINEIYQRFAPRISRMVVRNNGSETDAADVFQETLLMIYRKAHDQQFELTCPMEAFLYLVCRNRWINELQKRNRNVTITDEQGFDVGEDAAGAYHEFMVKEQRRQLVLEKLQLLDEGCRQLLQLTWAGQSLREIARTLNFTYAYARKKKSGCMSKLISFVRSANEYSSLKW